MPVSIKTGYGGQFLMVEALPVNPESDWLPSEAETIMRLASGFALSAEHEMARWRERFSRFSERAVVWGAGSKGITFLNALGPASSACEALVDLNPRKQGLFAPGVGVPIIAPEALVDANPNLVLISNGLYAPEIMTQVRNLHLNPKFAVIAG